MMLLERCMNIFDNEVKLSGLKLVLEAYERSTSHDQRAVETIIANIQSKRVMMHNCRNCHKLVSSGTKCEVTGDYHMDDHGD